MTDKEENSVLVAIDIRTQYIQKEIDQIKEDMKNQYVTQEEFKPIKSLVFGAVGLMLTTLVLAIIGLVLRGT